MPIYDYKCQQCSHDFSVGKRIADIDAIETCPSCKSDCDKTCRLITTAKEFYGEKPDEPFFSVSLGKWVTGKRQMRQIAKDKGWIEVGNENVEKMHDRSDHEREQRSRARWDDYINQRIEVRGNHA